MPYASCVSLNEGSELHTLFSFLKTREEDVFMRRLHHRIVLVLVPLLSLGLLFTVAGTASAHVNHAKVLSAIPAIGSTITQAPTTVTADCAENINPDPTKSNLFVYGPAGDLISQ